MWGTALPFPSCSIKLGERVCKPPICCLVEKPLYFLHESPSSRPVFPPSHPTASSCMSYSHGVLLPCVPVGFPACGDYSALSLRYPFLCCEKSSEDLDLHRKEAQHQAPFSSLLPFLPTHDPRLVQLYCGLPSIARNTSPKTPHV